MLHVTLYTLKHFDIHGIGCNWKQRNQIKKTWPLNWGLKCLDIPTLQEDQIGGDQTRQVFATFL